MKRLFALVATSTLVWVAAPSSLSAQEKTDEVAAAIVRLEQQWAGAQKTGHAAVVAPLLAEGFLNTDVDGKVAGQAQWLSHFKAGMWEQNEIGDVKGMVHGNTAIATGAWTGKGVESDGSKGDSHERSTNAWVKMPNGEWRGHQSEVKGRPGCAATG